MNAPALASIARDKYGRGSGKYDCSVRNVRMSGLTGRTAASQQHGERQQWCRFLGRHRRAACVTRIVAWRRRSTQAGNRGIGLGGSIVAMGICAMRVFSPGADRPVWRGALI